MQQLQRFRRKESSEFFLPAPQKVHFHYSTTVPARRHKVNSYQVFQNIGKKVAGSTHTEERIDSLWDSLLQGSTKARDEL